MKALLKVKCGIKVVCGSKLSVWHTICSIPLHTGVSLIILTYYSSLDLLQRMGCVGIVGVLVMSLVGDCGGGGGEHARARHSLKIFSS